MTEFQDLQPGNWIKEFITGEAKRVTQQDIDNPKRLQGCQPIELHPKYLQLFKVKQPTADVRWSGNLPFFYYKIELEEGHPFGPMTVEVTINNRIKYMHQLQNAFMRIVNQDPLQLKM